MLRDDTVSESCYNVFKVYIYKVYIYNVYIYNDYFYKVYIIFETC